MFFSVVLVLEMQHLFAKIHNKTNNLLFMVKCLVGDCCFRDGSFCLLELIITFHVCVLLLLVHSNCVLGLGPLLPGACLVHILFVYKKIKKNEKLPVSF